MAALKPGDMAWWVERQNDRPIHLTLVKVLREVDWAPGIYVKSIRSGRTYNADHCDLVPVDEITIPEVNRG